MFTDIQDFTKRMSEDENVGMSLLREHNGIMDEAVRNHHGSVVKNIGDSYLVDFSSAVNAVEAAIEAQNRFAEHNRGKPSFEQILVRISIHLGDIVVKGNDVFGDGVNIASRLQSLTPPGGICTSREVMSHVKSKISFQGVTLGTHELKGISEPIEVFQIFTPTVSAPAAAAPTKADERKAKEGPSIAVLPFANWSEDKENEYFSDGITEDIITDLAKIPTLRISSRNSVFSYKGKNVDIQKVGVDLNVRYVLEGSVRKAGNRLRITAQLIDASNNTHLWAERYDRQLEDIFAIQDEISQQIAKELKIRLTSEQQQAIMRKETDNLEAYDLYLKGLFYSRRRTKADLDLAVDYLNRALAVDPDFASAHSALAFALRFEFSFALDRNPTLLEMAKTHTERALAINPGLSEALLMKGLLLREEGRYPEAIKTLNELVQMNPSHTQAYAYLGNIYRDAGEVKKALEYHNRAMDLDPMDFFQPYNIAIDYWTLHDPENLMLMIERSAVAAPDHFLVWMLRGIVATMNGREKVALEYMETALRLDPHHFDTYGFRAEIHLGYGRFDDGYRDLRVMLDNSKDSLFAILTCLPYFVHLRRFDEASRIIGNLLLRKHALVETGRDSKVEAFLYRGMILRSLGDKEKAHGSFLSGREAITKALGQFPDSSHLRASRGLIEATLGEFESAERDLRNVQSEEPRHPRFAYEFARVYSLKNDKKSMLHWLKKSIELGKWEFAIMKIDIFFEPFAKDPEFLSVFN